MYVCSLIYFSMTYLAYCCFQFGLFFLNVDFNMCFTSSLNSANPCIHVYLLLLFYRSFTWQFIMECLLPHIRHFSQLMCLFYVIFYRSDLSFLLFFIRILSIFTHTCVCTKLFQLCLTLCDCSPPGSSVQGIRQACWSGLPCLPPGDLPDPGIKLEFLMSPALAGGFFTTSATWEAQIKYIPIKIF